MDDRAAVIAANAEFYRAFEALDLTRMEERWLRAPTIKCVHPGWGLLVGWGPVMDSWARIFANTAAMRFTLTHVHVEIAGDLAWVVVRENIESEHKDEQISSHVLATNLFQRHEGRWLLVHHHGSPVYPPFVETEPERMH
jgi:ketosteroid isomerase-like protein